MTVSRLAPPAARGPGADRGRTHRATGDRLRRWLLALLMLPAVAWTSGPLPPAAAGPSPRPVVVVGLAGLAVDDLSPATTPHLWRLVERGGVGALVVRSVHLDTCPVDGWLTLAAGTRAAQPEDGPCRTLPAPPTSGGGVVPGWSDYVAAATTTRQDAHLGALADTLTRHGTCVAAVGPGAGVAAASGSGQVARWSAYATSGLRERLAACPVTLVDPGAVRASDPDRAGQVRALDLRLGEVLAAAPADATVVVAALADDGAGARLRPVVVGPAGDQGGAEGVGVLRSAATRQPGYVLLTDVAPTVAAWATGVRHPTWAAEPWTVQPDDAPAAARVAAVADHADAARLVQPVALAFWPTWALTQLLACLVVGLLCRRADPDRRGRLLRGLSRGVVAMSCVPAATYLAGLVPWWRGGAVALWLVIYAFAGSLAAVALLGPWRRRPFGPPAAVAALTALTVGGDAVTGSHLTLSTLLGEQPTVAGRFYGLGNVAFSLLATATLLVMVAVAGHDRRAGRPRRGALLAGLVGLAAVAVDGLPTWGADLGGPIALLPAVVVFVLVALGLRLTWSRVLGIGLVTALAVTALAVADYLRPAGSRSHLGRFVQTLGDGGAADVVARKAAQNLQMLLTAPLAFLVPIGLLAAAWVVARPDSTLGRLLRPGYEQVPLLRTGLASILLVYAVGFATNDSGVAIPAVGATVLIPLVVATVLAIRHPRP
ncbi:hypothetical protein [Arsenicicoccus dermatophilus]|uniref:hypothetical protein n=1 Tax=Arsenicicoccus dermatophilus TaxID=1076331 RepID=UPI001F4D1DEC|nr:hypothetical protein [Arsenicicoccus dermatophilus]MCH8611515.1 hypothetical protein [Arsenicicoccus dermatophilus]